MRFLLQTKGDGQCQQSFELSTCVLRAVRLWASHLPQWGWRNRETRYFQSRAETDIRSSGDTKIVTSISSGTSASRPVPDYIPGYTLESFSKFLFFAFSL